MSHSHSHLLTGMINKELFTDRSDLKPRYSLTVLLHSHLFTESYNPQPQLFTDGINPYLQLFTDIFHPQPHIY